jgi:hypothetical protein
MAAPLLTRIFSLAFKPREQCRCVVLRIALAFQMYVSRMASATIHVQRQAHAAVQTMGNIGESRAQIHPGPVRFA